MSDQAVEILITNAIHTAFIKYPEGDGGPNLDYEWIAPDHRAAARVCLEHVRRYRPERVPVPSTDFCPAEFE